MDVYDRAFRFFHILFPGNRSLKVERLATVHKVVHRHHLSWVLTLEKWYLMPLCLAIKEKDQVEHSRDRIGALSLTFG